MRAQGVGDGSHPALDRSHGDGGVGRSSCHEPSDGELFYIIKNGIRLTGMPAWGEDTPDDDRSSNRITFHGTTGGP